MILLGTGLLAVGLLLALLGAVALVRLRSFALRVKAFAMVNTCGAVAVHLATDCFVPDLHLKGALTALLFLVSGPMLSQALLGLEHREALPGVAPGDDSRRGGDAN